MRSSFGVMLRPRFMQFVRRARHLLAHLAELRLVLERGEFQLYRDDWDYICAKLPLASPIHRLHIETLYPGDIALLMRALRPRIASLDVFSFWSCNWDRPTLWRILGAYPELGTVFAYPYYIAESDDAMEQDDELAARNSSPKRTFVVHWEDALSVHEWGQPPARAAAVYLAGVEVPAHQDSDRMITAAGRMAPLVQGLELLSFGNVNSLCPAIVRAFPALRVLHLVFSNLFSVATADLCSKIISLLDALQGSCTRLRVLVLDFETTFDRVDSLRDRSWASLDARLGDPLWASLRLIVSVRVAFAKISIPTTLRNYFMAQLPATLARGQLTVICEGYPTWRCPPRESFVHFLTEKELYAGVSRTGSSL